MKALKAASKRYYPLGIEKLKEKTKYCTTLLQQRLMTERISFKDWQTKVIKL
jgi:hypothetical protein